MHEPVGMGGVLAALSVTSDLTRGHPPGEAMRACLLAVELARMAGLSVGSQGDAYYGALMRFAGCAATSHETAAWFGGDHCPSWKAAWCAPSTSTSGTPPR